MSVSRRSALVCVPVLAVSATDSSIASTLRGMSLGDGVNSAPGTDQRVHHLLIHRDAGVQLYAAVSVASGDTAWMAHNDLDERGYADASNKYALRGYRLRRVSAFQTKKGMRYAAAWQLAPGSASETHHGMTAAQFGAQSESFAARGYAIAHLDGCMTSSGARFAAIWEKRSATGQKTFTGLNGTELKQTIAELTAQGYRPRQISAYAPDGRTRFAAVFEKSGARDWMAHHAMRASVFRERSNTMLAEGYRLSDASGYVVRGRPMFSGIWEKA